MIDFYFDRNKNDKIINSSQASLFKFINKNPNNKFQTKWGVLLKTNNKIAIMFGSKSITKPNTYFREKIQKYYDYVLIIEQGYINRKIYRSLSWNKQGGKSNIKPTNCDDIRLKKLNLDLKPIKNNANGYILVCGQLPWDSQVQYAKPSYNKWLNNVFIKLKKNKRKIIYRPHPLYNQKRGKLNIPKFVEIDTKTQLEKCLNNAYVVISFNSTVLIEAVINGNRIICFDDMTLVYSLAKHNVNDIDNLKLYSEKDRYETLCNISYNQWTLDEFKNGKALNYMLTLIGK